MTSESTEYLADYPCDCGCVRTDRRHTLAAHAGHRVTINLKSETESGRFRYAALSCLDCGHGITAEDNFLTPGHGMEEETSPPAGDAPRCGCENSACERPHPAGNCQNPGSVPVMYVGTLCSECAPFMPAEYLVVEESK